MDPINYSPANYVVTPESRWTKVRKLVKPLGFILVIALILVVMNVIKVRSEYQKPQTWVISQSLNSSLNKQNKILGAAKNGQITLGDLAKVATDSSQIKPEVVKIKNDYLMSTGAEGTVEAEIALGTYEVQLAKIPEIDFTGIPGTIKIANGSYSLNIGLVKGSGKVRAEGGRLKVEDRNGKPKIIVKLFQDKNGNGKKDSGESSLSWAGIVIKLVRQ